MPDAREQLLEAAARLAAGRSLVGGLSGCAFSIMVAARARAGLLLCLTPGPETAEDIALDIEALAPGLQTLIAPVMDENNPDKQALWISLLARVAHLEGPAVLLTPAAALIEALPSPAEIKSGNLVLKPGAKVKLEELFKQLIDAGMQRVEQVESGGQFARRGGIVDIYPPSMGNPVRLELFGDVIESVRAFDVETQRSFESLAEGAAFPLVPVEGGRDAMLLDHLPKHTVIALEPAQVAERLRTLASFSEDPARHKRIERAHQLVAGADALTHEDTETKLECARPVSLGEGYEGVAALLKPLTDAGR